MIVDLFCGVGGASVGIRAALQRSPTVSVDFDAEPLALHATNFPYSAHTHADVSTLNLSDFAREHIDVLWLSPPCPDFSRASAGRGQDPHRRQLADVTVEWARTLGPTLICLENVEQFKHWGPYSPRTQRTAGNYEGDSFRRMILKLRQLGYMVEYRILSADDYGVPTIRRRLYLVAKFGGRDIRWPEETTQRKTMLDVIDWTVRGQHAFTRPRALGEATAARVRHGLAHLVTDAVPGFIVPVNNGGTSGQARSLALPSLTLTASPSGGCFALCHVVDGEPYFRMLTVRENYRLQGFPASFITDLLPDGRPATAKAAIRGAGNAVCPPMAEQIVRLNAE